MAPCLQKSHNIEAMALLRHNVARGQYTMVAVVASESKLLENGLQRAAAKERCDKEKKQALGSSGREPDHNSLPT